MKLLSAPMPNMSLRLRLGGGNGFVRSGLMLFVVLPQKKKKNTKKEEEEEERRNLRSADSSREFEFSAPVVLGCKLAKMVLRLRLGAGNGLCQVGSAVIVLPKTKT